jgi:hypothetical protein
MKSLQLRIDPSTVLRGAGGLVNKKPADAA